jgi:predicted dehydrogenase
MTRRTLLAAAGAALTSTAKSYAQVSGANDRIRIGVIGCGGQSNSHMRTLVKMRESDNIDIGGVCDVFSKRASQAAELTGGKVFRDYREMLTSKDIDYVLIATPEHWHYQMIVDTIDAGKHVYTEKPMTHHIEEAKKVVAKMKNAKVKLQVGVQGMSDDSYETANKYVKQGVLGKVVAAQIDYSRNHVDDFWAYPLDPDVRPGDNLDWNAWLGPAAKRPFDPERFGRWRRYWDYSGGIASDLFVHRVTRIMKSLDLKFPDYVVSTGGKFEFASSKAEIPDTFNVLLDYPGGPTVQLISSMANDTRVQHLIRGHKATLEFNSTGFTITPQSEFANDLEPIVHQKTGGEVLDLHHRNLFNAIRKNEAIKCDVMLGYYGVVACEMSVASYRTRKYLKWDGARERMIKA